MTAFINIFFSVKLIVFALLFSLGFSWRQEKRSLFPVRCISFIAVATVLHYFMWEWIKRSGDYFLLFDILFVGYCSCVVIAFNLVCFKCRVIESMLFAVGASTLEHLSDCLSTVIGMQFDLGQVLHRPYSLEYFAVTLSVYLITFAVFFILFALRVKERKINIDRKNLTIPVVAVFVVFRFMNHWVSLFYHDEAHTIFMTKLYALAFSVVLLVFIINLFESSKYRVELEVLEQLERKNKEQYELSKDTIEIINTKCHDIKKILSSSLSKDGVLSGEDLESLQEKISIYDNLISTDNKTLNIVLNEKSLYCEKHGVQLSLSAPYSDLDFMSKMDIYSLFANILDNAIEAVMKLPVEKKIISLSVRKVGAMLSVHSDNPFDGELTFNGSDIITSKQDKTYHGYGLMSIRRVVDKYDGAVNLKTDDNVFVIDIIFPIPQ